MVPIPDSRNRPSRHPGRAPFAALGAAGPQRSNRSEDRLPPDPRTLPGPSLQPPKLCAPAPIVCADSLPTFCRQFAAMLISGTGSLTAPMPSPSPPPGPLRSRAHSVAPRRRFPHFALASPPGTSNEARYPGGHHGAPPNNDTEHNRNVHAGSSPGPSTTKVHPTPGRRGYRRSLPTRPAAPTAADRSGHLNFFNEANNLRGMRPASQPGPSGRRVAGRRHRDRTATQAQRGAETGVVGANRKPSCHLGEHIVCTRLIGPSRRRIAEGRVAHQGRQPPASHHHRLSPRCKKRAQDIDQPRPQRPRCRPAPPPEQPGPADPPPQPPRQKAPPSKGNAHKTRLASDRPRPSAHRSARARTHPCGTPHRPRRGSAS